MGVSAQLPSPVRIRYTEPCEVGGILSTSSVPSCNTWVGISVVGGAVGRGAVGKGAVGRGTV